MSQQNFVSYDDATSIITEVASKIAEKQDVLSFDNSPTQNSDNPVKSGGVYTALASKANTSDIGTAAAKNFTTSVTSGSNDLVTSGAVYTAIDNLPEPMVFKGSLGTGGTITALPVNGTATVGDTYKVITAGTYDSKAAKVGDTFICLTKTSSANTWELIPSGDEPSGTVTSVTLKATSPIAIDSSSAITSSGTRTLSHANSGATAGSYGDSGNQTPGYGSTFKVPYVTVNATGHVTAISEHTVKIPASDNTNTTYTFANGTNGFTVTPSGGSAQTVTVTPNDSTKLPLAGGTMTGNLTISKSSPKIQLTNSDAVAVGTDVPLLSVSYKNSTNNLTLNTSPISVIGTDSTDGYNVPVRLGSTSGTTIVGAGESSVNFASKQSKYNDEDLYLVSDNNIRLYKKMVNDGSLGNGPYEAAGFTGTITSGQVVVSDGTVGGIKSSGYTIGKSVPSDAKFTDTTYTAATAAPGAIAASGSAGTSTNYARQDHTHAITVATGDSNGQVKIAGQNASVKGLGSNAYTSTSYLPLAGGTMTGTLTTTPNDVNINFRNHASYYCTASYQTAGNEALVFATKNSVTSFMFVSGEDSVTNHAQDRWRSLTPGLQIKQNCVSINKLIADGTSPSYTLEVNGTQYVSGVLTTGDAISATGDITAGGLLTAKAGVFQGRVYNAGDDEGIIIKQTTGGYAGLVLGSHNARRSVFYLNNSNVFWRYNNGSTSYDINHPGKSGTIALTSDVTNATDPIFYGTCSTAANTAAKVVTASKFSGLATGVTIYVKFSNDNSADNPTLNVNSTGAKAIWKSGGIIKSSNPGWMANEVVSFTYDGTRWIMNDILSSGRLHTQGYNNRCDTSLMTCSVAGRSASLGGLINVTQATQDIFTIGATGAYVIDTPAQGILINQSTKTIYPIVGIDNLFSSVSGNVPVGNYTVLCNFRVTYTYQDFA